MEADNISEDTRQAAEIIINNGYASVQLLQRKMKIEYDRCCELMLELEKLGVVGPFKGNAPRDILVKSLAEIKF